VLIVSGLTQRGKTVIIESCRRLDQAFVQMCKSDSGIWYCLELDVVSREQAFGRLFAVVELEFVRRIDGVKQGEVIRPSQAVGDNVTALRPAGARSRCRQHNSGIFCRAEFYDFIKSALNKVNKVEKHRSQMAPRLIGIIARTMSTPPVRAL
jgi:hypothetical protein